MSIYPLAISNACKFYSPVNKIRYVVGNSMTVILIYLIGTQITELIALIYLLQIK